MPRRCLMRSQSGRLNGLDPGGQQRHASFRGDRDRSTLAERQDSANLFRQVCQVVCARRAAAAKTTSFHLYSTASMLQTLFHLATAWPSFSTPVPNHKRSNYWFFRRFFPRHKSSSLFPGIQACSSILANCATRADLAPKFDGVELKSAVQPDLKSSIRFQEKTDPFAGRYTIDFLLNADTENNDTWNKRSRHGLSLEDGSYSGTTLSLRDVR